MTDKKYFYAIGRRKTASVNVRLFTGSGASMINNKPVEEVITLATSRTKLLKPFIVADLRPNDFHFTAKTQGGGFSAQLEALNLALAKAIVQYEPTLRKVLKTNRLLTRDPRMVERKKPGHRKARKSEQFSKR